MTLNSSIVILEESSEIIYLKLGRSDKIVKMSPTEFAIISRYSIVKNMEDVQEYFKSTVDIRKEQFDLLLKKAYESEILVDNNSTPKNSAFVKLVLKRSHRIFEIFSIDFTKTYLERLIERKGTIQAGLILIVASVSFFIANIFNGPLNFKANYFETLYNVPVPFSTIFGFIYLASFISTLIHELGHYFFYKLARGKTSMFGIGLLYFFIPVFFSRILVGVISKKQSRILINFGGIVFDILQAIFILYFTKEYHKAHPVLAFFAYTLLFSLGIRTFFNLNVFLPSSDGYHILTELVNNPKFYEYAVKKAKNIWQVGKVVTIENYLLALYMAISYLFIAISFAMISLPILAYFYYAVHR